MDRKSALQRLLNPGTLAVVGGNSAREVVRQCRQAGFGGEIWAVNSSGRGFDGAPCFTSIADLPETPDAAFIAVPPVATIEIVRQLSMAGAAGAVCFAAGFSETGANGLTLQNQLREAAGNMAIIGPNCHGFLNYLDRVALWPDQHGGRHVDRGVALVLQSGNIGINLSMQQRSLSISHLITVGNKAVLDIHDYVDVLIDDPRVAAIGLHIEGLGDVGRFSCVAIKALRKGIPIVAMKAGRSALGARMTMSHTSSLAGPDKLYNALFKRLGIARCTTLSQFLETLKFVSTVGSLPGRRVGSMSCSGGEASLTADAAETIGIEMPPLTPETTSSLRAVLGAAVNLDNPLDYHSYAWGNYEQLYSCFSAMLANPFDCTLLILDYPLNDAGAAENWKTTERALIDAVVHTGQRAVVVATLPENLPVAARDRLLAAGITPMQGLEDCLYAIRSAAFMGTAQKNAASILPVRRPELETTPIDILDECQSKSELAAFGLSIPHGVTCDADGIVAAATAVGYPVVLKAVSNELAHKTEAGAVATDIANDDELRRAVNRMHGRFDRFLVEKMVGPCAAELIVGVSRDPTFGLTLLLGAGGTMVELLDDTISLLLPLQRQEILDALGSLRVAKLIGPHRGRAAVNIEPVIDAIDSVVRYADAHHSSLVELDVNPLIVLADGAVAVDAFIRRTQANG